METEQVKCLIIGSGPAGYTAAIYAGRANLSPVLYAGLQPGGQLTTTTEVENFPGYPSGIGGPELMEDLRKQAERFGTDIRYGVAMSADFSSSPYKVTMDDGKVIEARTVIIATGATAKYLGPRVTASSIATGWLPWWGAETRLAKRLPTFPAWLRRCT